MKSAGVCDTVGDIRGSVWGLRRALPWGHSRATIPEANQTTGSNWLGRDVSWVRSPSNALLSVSIKNTRAQVEYQYGGVIMARRHESMKGKELGDVALLRGGREREKGGTEREWLARMWPDKLCTSIYFRQHMTTEIIRTGADATRIGYVRAELSPGSPAGT